MSTLSTMSRIFAYWRSARPRLAAKLLRPCDGAPTPSHCGMFSRGMRLGAVSILAMFAIPASTFAFSVEEIIETANAGNGTVVETHSSASTGGQTAGSGETITTGDSSVSSHTRTEINTNDSGGTVEVKVEKTVNGETETKEYTEKIPAGAPVHVNVDAHASSDEPATTSEETQDDIEVHIETAGEKPNFFTDTVPLFFHKVVSFFLWF